MKKIAFIFPGQGSQSVGMGKELAAMYPPAQQTFDEADEALGYKISELCFNGPEKKLKLTEITQPAILTVSVAAFRVLREKDRGFADLFHILPIRESSEPQTRRILIHGVRALEERHRCRFDAQVLPAVMAR